MSTTATPRPQRAAWPRPAEPKAHASFVLCAGLFLAWVSLPDDNPFAIFRTGAVVVGAALLLALLIEARSGPRSLLRVDVLMLLALYGLTFVEFLFPQPDIATALTAQAARAGTAAVLLGFAGLALGRHFASHATGGHSALASVHLPANTLALVFIGAFFVGYFHMLWAVDFDPVALVSEMLEPRFSQPWGRERFGSWAALIHELGLLIYLLPPLAGIVLARRSDYGPGLVAMVSLGFAFVLFQSFASGTRNVFAVHVITFCVAYLMFQAKLTFTRVAIMGVFAGLVLLASTHYMLEFRRVGLGQYVEEGTSEPTDDTKTLVVDQNLLTISALTAAFPERYDYLGLEIPYNALIHPIPRALWAGKPTGLSVSIEQAAGVAEGVTLAATFVGEAYISGGYLAVLGASLLLGALGARWNRLGQNARSNFDIALYASGFFAAALAMRSILWVSVAMLPTLALWVYGRWFLRKSIASRYAHQVRFGPRR